MQNELLYKRRIKAIFSRDTGYLIHQIAETYALIHKLHIVFYLKVIIFNYYLHTFFSNLNIINLPVYIIYYLKINALFFINSKRIILFFL